LNKIHYLMNVNVAHIHPSFQKLMWREHTGWDDRQSTFLDGNQEAKARKNGETYLPGICHGI
jgi:hypothetical protein